MKDETEETVREWIAKAESDWSTVEILSSHLNCPKDSVCFHCQQYVEKLLKAFLTLRRIEAPMTHDIRRLLQLTVPFAPEISTLMDRADMLSDHAVQSRYPGDWREIDSAEMQEMIELAKEFAAILLPKLEL